MAGKQKYNQVCPIATMLDVVGSRWALLVVRELALGPRRFKDIHTCLETASTDMLTSRLRELELAGLIDRADDRRYQLTPAGRALAPVMRQMMIWSFRTRAGSENESGEPPSFGPDPTRRLVGLLALTARTTPIEDASETALLSVGSLEVVIAPGGVGYEFAEGTIDDPSARVRFTNDGLFAFLLAGESVAGLVKSGGIESEGEPAERVLAHLERAVAGVHAEINAPLA